MEEPTLDNSCTHDGAHPGVSVVYNSCVHWEQQQESNTIMCNCTTGKLFSYSYIFIIIISKRRGKRICFNRIFFPLWLMLHDPYLRRSCKSLQLRFPPTQPMICREHSGKCDSYPAGWGCCEMLAARCRWLCSGHKLQASLKETQKSKRTKKKMVLHWKRLNLTKENNWDLDRFRGQLNEIQALD